MVGSFDGTDLDAASANSWCWADGACRYAGYIERRIED
jgi:hypothetical protein